jgi:spermidine synthase
MSSVLTDPRVTVHIGDGFKFLSDNERTYDVIITDSSDPVGPAEALFQKPYFKLLHDALAPGGHISNQGECPWLNLNFIQEMRKFTTEIFVTTEYAYSSVPTYPTGQIGFVLCTKAPGRNIRVPVREVKNCRYYNGDVHKAAFVLPEFAKTLLEDDKDIRPKFGRAAKAVKAEALNSSTKNILLLGSGFAAHPCAEYIVRDPTNRLTIGESDHYRTKENFKSDLNIASRNLSSAQALAYSLPATAVMFLDLNNTETLEKAVAGHDLVISLVPCTFHAAVIRAAIKCKTHVVTASYISPAMRELDAEAKAAGIVVFNEIGLEPGIDHLYAVKTINEVHAKGGKGSLATVKLEICSY